MGIQRSRSYLLNENTPRIQNNISCWQLTQQRSSIRFLKRVKSCERSVEKGGGQGLWRAGTGETWKRGTKDLHESVESCAGDILVIAR